jgi:hypothetical protein
MASDPAPSRGRIQIVDILQGFELAAVNTHICMTFYDKLFTIHNRLISVIHSPQ